MLDDFLLLFKRHNAGIYSDAKVLFYSYSANKRTVFFASSPNSKFSIISIFSYLSLNAAKSNSPAKHHASVTPFCTTAKGRDAERKNWVEQVWRKLTDRRYRHSSPPMNPMSLKT